MALLVEAITAGDGDAVKIYGLLEYLNKPIEGCLLTQKPPIVPKLLLKVPTTKSVLSKYLTDRPILFHTDHIAPKNELHQPKDKNYKSLLTQQILLKERNLLLYCINPPQLLM